MLCPAFDSKIYKLVSRYHPFSLFPLKEYTHTHTSVCMYVYPKCVSIHTHVCVCNCVYIYIYTHTYEKDYFFTSLNINTSLEHNTENAPAGSVF